MNVEHVRWRRMREVFESALEHPVSQRDSFVADACGDDPSLVAEVSDLLSAHAEAGSFLDSAVITAALNADYALDERRQRLPEIELAGQVVSHYRLDERLGAGGMGVVYRAHDLALGRPVAIKVLPTAFSPALRAALLREADACARLQHPAVATYFESGESGSMAFIAMELVEGRTLRERLKAGAIPVEQTVAIAHCLLEALVHAHSVDILHCDIKPANIIVTGPRSAKLLDFGLAKHLLASSPDGAVRDISVPEVIAGTIGYMSPEQILGEPLDARSDIFQVGTVLYEMLTGLPAFGGATALARLAAVLSKAPPPMTVPGLQTELATIAMRALSRKPDARYPTAAAMLREVVAISSRESMPVLPGTLAIPDYARGQRLFNKLEKGTMEQGLEFFERAIELDARSAPALTGLASVYAMRFTYTTDPAMLVRAVAYAQRAIDVDPMSGNAHAWLGYAMFRLHRTAEADAEWRRAREFEPSSVWGFYFGAVGAHLLGRTDEALALAARAVELEPTVASTWYGLGSLHLDLGHLREALWAYERARHVNTLPDASPFPDVGGFMAECQRRAGRLDEARALCLDSLELIEHSDHMYRDSFRLYTLVVLGVVSLDRSDSAAARAAFNQAIAHLKGRPRTLAGGWLLVRALAGLACSDCDAAPYAEARRRIAARSEFDFSWLWQCDEPHASADLARSERFASSRVRVKRAPHGAPSAVTPDRRSVH